MHSFGGEIIDPSSACIDIDIFPSHDQSLSIFTGPELDLMINGNLMINISELKKSKPPATLLCQFFNLTLTNLCKIAKGAAYNGCCEGENSERLVEWFWEIWASFSAENQGNMLKFITGSNRVPIDGLDPPMTVTLSDKSPDNLPTTHSCFNQIVLPHYISREQMQEKMAYAVDHVDGFHLT